MCGNETYGETRHSRTFQKKIYANDWKSKQIDRNQAKTIEIILKTFAERLKSNNIDENQRKLTQSNKKKGNSIILGEGIKYLRKAQ